MDRSSVYNDTELMVILEADCGKEIFAPVCCRCLVRSDSFASEPDTGKPSSKRMLARPLMLMPPIPIKWIGTG